MSRSSATRPKTPVPEAPAVAPPPTFYRLRADSRRALVLWQLWKDGPISRGALADRMGLNLPMVSACVQELIKEGELVEEGYACSTGGRKAQLLDVNPRRGGVVAIEFTRRGIHSASADMKGRLSNHVMRDFDFSLGVKAAITAIIDSVRHQIEFLEDDERLSLSRIGIVTCGPVDEKNGISIAIPSFTGWENVPIAQMLEDEFEVPVTLGNHVVATTLAETISGQFRDMNTFLFLHLGPGLGIGFVLDGSVYRGQQTMVGELGAFTLADPKSGISHGEECDLEAIATPEALVAAVKARVAAGEKTSIPKHVDPNGRMTFEAIFRAADLGDTVAREIIDRAGYHLGSSLASLINLLGPQAILVGGTMVDDGERLLLRMQETARRRTLAHLVPSLRFEPASFGAQAGVAGAAAVALLAHYNTFAE